MAWSSEYLSATDWARYLADKPTILGASAAGATSSWRWTEGTIADTDHTDARYPTIRASDFLAHTWTAPDAGYATDNSGIALVMVLDPAATFDTIAILGHNFTQMQNADDTLLYVQLEIADDYSFETNVQQIFGRFWSPGTLPRERIIGFELNHDAASEDGVNSRQYTGVAWARLFIHTYSGTPLPLRAAPRIGEVLIGQRRQLARKPDEPWDDNRSRAIVADFRAESGAMQRTILSQGQRVDDAAFTFATDNEAAALRAAFTDCKRGGRPVLWTPAPYSAPKRSFYGFIEPDLDMPFSGGPTVRTARFHFEEIIPYVASEEE